MDLFKEMQTRAMLMEEDDGGSGGALDTDSPSGGLGSHESGDFEDNQPGETPTNGDTGADDAEQSFQIGDETYSEQQMLDALELAKNKAQWEGELHTRGQELNTLVSALERARLGEPMGQQAHAPDETPPGHVNMSADEIRDMVLDKPEEFFGLLQKTVQEVTRSAVENALGEQTTKQTAEQHFLGKHVDFNEVTASQEFQQYMATLPTDHQGNPIYSPTNAYLTMKLEQAHAELDKAKEAGYRAGEEATRKNLDAKNRIKVLKGGGGAPPPPQEGINPAKMSENEVNQAALQFVLDRRAQG